MTKALRGSWSEWERISAFMVEVLTLERDSLDSGEFTVMWKRGSSLEKFRMVWSTEKGEENDIDETIINALIEILYFI